MSDENLNGAVPAANTQPQPQGPSFSVEKLYTKKTTVPFDSDSIQEAVALFILAQAHAHGLGLPGLVAPAAADGRPPRRVQQGRRERLR